MRVRWRSTALINVQGVGPTNSRPTCCKSDPYAGAGRMRDVPYAFLVLAYCFAAFTAMMVVGLFWLGWWHRREERRRDQERREAFTRR